MTDGLPEFPKNDKGAEYNDIIALWMCACSKLVYKQTKDITSELKQLGFSRVDYFISDATQCFLAEHPGDGAPFAVLSFRGTEADYKDILTDITVLKRPMPGYDESVHGGFLTALNTVWGTHLPASDDAFAVNAHGAAGVSDKVAQLSRQSRLYLTGHSLGGALATLAAYRLQSTRQITALYTIGSPRVVSKTFAQVAPVLGHYYRIVNQQDLVTHIPTLNFRHVGQEQHLISRHGKIERLVGHFTDKFAMSVRLWGVLVIFFSFLIAWEIKDPGVFLRNQLIENIQFEAQGVERSVAAEITFFKDEDTPFGQLVDSLVPFNEGIQYHTNLRVAYPVIGTIILKKDTELIQFLINSGRMAPSNKLSVSMDIDIDDDLALTPPLNTIKIEQRIANDGRIVAYYNRFITWVNTRAYMVKLQAGVWVPNFLIDNIVLIVLQMVLFFIPLWIVLTIRRLISNPESAPRGIKKGVIRQAILVSVLFFFGFLIEVKALLPSALQTGWIDNVLFISMLVGCLLLLYKLLNHLPKEGLETLFSAIEDHKCENYYKKLTKIEKYNKS